MTKLQRLRVSLTKHGAHKLVTLFERYPASTILNNLDGSYNDIYITLTQARKNLSVHGGVVPKVWDEARNRGRPFVRGLALIAIIFSHIDLINAMRASAIPGKKFQGEIRRGERISGKAFTNIKCTLIELGFATSNSPQFVSYDLSALFSIEGLHTLAAEVLRLKLEDAGWSKENSFLDELNTLGLHEVFAISESELRSWLVTGDMHESHVDLDDEFFALGSDLPTHNIAPKFRSGHKPKKTGVVVVNAVAPRAAQLQHNAMQTKLYEQLVAEHGPQCVGTEIPTGDGCSIDVVLKTASLHVYYEIKTAPTTKACIRQALPQLLEYAYWGGGKNHVDLLVVVGPSKATPEGERYLCLLKNRFGLPLEYMHIATGSI